MRNSLRWPWAPFLLGIYPFLHLYSVNADRVYFAAVGRPFLATLACTAAVALLTFAWTRNLARGAIVMSAFFFFFSVFNGAEQVVFGSTNDTTLARPLQIGVMVLTLLATLVVERMIRRATNLERWLEGLNVMAFLLVAPPLVQLTFRQEGGAAQKSAPEKIDRSAASSQLPDVYYIVLDGYAREDVLRDYFGYDNHRFISFLKSHGFFVGDDSTSNYAYTILSLTSTLNMNFLSDLDENPQQMKACLQRLHANRVMKLFKSHGYRIVHFASGWFTDVDPYADKIMNSSGLDEFNLLLWRSLPFGSLLRPNAANANKSRILSTLAQLGMGAHGDGPTFTFAHLICPHPPFLFDRRGATPPVQSFGARPSGARDWFPKDRYVDQLSYLSDRVEVMVNQILKNSKRPPIIIIQSDHGPACDGTSAHPSRTMVRERMGILYALYAPGDFRAKLYPTITPVNTFRILANALFGSTLKLFPDRRFYSGPMDAMPYKFIDVTADFPAPSTELEGKSTVRPVPASDLVRLRLANPAHP
jgi:hypothetical protein